jgi:tetratricopeptide (TPR) repeat protein
VTSSGGLDPAVVGAYLADEIDLRAAVGLDDQDLHALRTLGHGYLENGRFGDACVVFEGLVEVDADSAWAHAALGAAYQNLDQEEEALAEYDEALRLDPGEMTALVNRGELRITAGRAEEGIEDLAAAAECDPSTDDAQANRARALLAATRQILEEALGS